MLSVDDGCSNRRHTYFMGPRQLPNRFLSAVSDRLNKPTLKPNVKDKMWISPILSERNFGPIINGEEVAGKRNESDKAG